MSKFKISFIGGGNMAEAILSRVIENGVISKESVMICDIAESRLEYIKTKYDVNVTYDANVAVDFANLVFLAVKPQYFKSAVEDIKDNFKDKAVVSIMAGVPIDSIKNALGSSSKVLRVMPNTPAQVGEGMSVLCSETDFNDSELSFSKEIFSSIGEYEMLSEKYIDAVTGVSGSGPAYVYMFIEALSDAGVYNGLPRDVSYKLAAQTVLGAAKMVIETKLHPGTLKDMVSSPGGTTIEAISSLENDGFRGTVMNAVNACTEKSRYLSQGKNEKN